MPIRKIRGDRMNLKVLKWLLAHQSQLLQIVDIAKGYSKDLPYIQQWEIADKIARIVIPILEAEATQPKVLSYDDIYDYFTDDTTVTPSREVQILQCGSEVQALAIDWKLVAETIVPLVVAILRALLREEE
jgi:hypothetical protein